MKSEEREQLDIEVTERMGLEYPHYMEVNIIGPGYQVYENTLFEPTKHWWRVVEWMCPATTVKDDKPLGRAFSLSLHRSNCSGYWSAYFSGSVHIGHRDENRYEIRTAGVGEGDTPGEAVCRAFIEAVRVETGG